jgi:hypothetical protein
MAEADHIDKLAVGMRQRRNLAHWPGAVAKRAWEIESCAGPSIGPASPAARQIQLEKPR